MKEQRTCKCGKSFIATRKDQFACCKRCRNHYYMEEWHKAHPTYSAESGRKWRLANPDKARALNRWKYRKVQIIKYITILMSNISTVKFSKIEFNKVKVLRMIEREKKVYNFTEKHHIGLASVKESKKDVVKPVITHTPDNAPTASDTHVVTTYKFQNNLVYLFQRNNGSYFWKSYIAGKCVLTSVDEFSESSKAVSDIRLCFQ